MFGGNWEYEIEISHKALKQIKGIDKASQVRIKNAIEKLRKVPPQADIKKVKGADGTVYRLREGNWRIFFEYHSTERMVKITSIHHRKEAYQ